MLFECCFLAFSLSSFITWGFTEMLWDGVISSCPIYLSTKVLMPPLGHCLLVGRRSQRTIESQNSMQSCRTAQGPWGQATTMLKGKLTLASSTTALLPFPGYGHAQVKVLLHVPFAFPFCFVFFKWGHQLFPSDLTHPALRRHWCGCRNWRRDRWQSWKKTQRVLGLPIYSGQFRAYHLNIHSW